MQCQQLQVVIAYKFHSFLKLHMYNVKDWDPMEDIIIPQQFMLDDITEQYIESVYNDCELLRQGGYKKDLGSYLQATFAYLKFNMEVNCIQASPKTDKMINAISIMM